MTRQHITGRGLNEARTGAKVVIDLTNSPSSEDKAVPEFFETSGIPYTIIRPTQFWNSSAASPLQADGNVVRLSPVLFQPIAADDIAPIVAAVALDAFRVLEPGASVASDALAQFNAAHRSPPPGGFRLASRGGVAKL